jgi:prevent-host-death family protein
MSIKRANIGELKTHLSRYVKGVKGGGSVLITERNVPVAKIVPLDDDDQYESEEAQLIAEGIITPPQSNDPLPEDFFDDLPFVPGNRALDVLLDERYGD